MKQVILIICTILLSLGTQAQRGPGPRAERIHAIKIGYLTDRLHLTSAQATTFWPVYDKYESELREARRSFIQKYRRDNKTDDRRDNDDAESLRYVEDNLDFQEQMLSINRSYKDQFLKIISPQQLATLYDAERDFKKLLLQQLRQRRARN